MSDRLLQALEAAIAADFDDVASHAAYADRLQERGDPRGELIAVQLRLEDERLPARRRRALAARERELLAAHGAEWLGDLRKDYTLVPATDEHRQVLTLRRGWIESLSVQHAWYRRMERLAQAPLARCLQRLEIDYAYEEIEHDENWNTLHPPPVPPGTPDYNEFYVPLLDALFLPTLRYFRIGEGAEAQGPYWMLNATGTADLLPSLLERTPRLEELHLLARTEPNDSPEAIFRLPLPNLRVLRAYHLYDHATATLAANRSLKGLTHLLFHSHADDPCFAQRAPYLTLDDLRRVLASRHLKGLKHLQFRLSGVGDEGCALIARSGVLKRLDVLDLRHGCITDAGIRHLVGSPDLPRLTHLELSRNALTPRGIALLQGCGVPFTADAPYPPDDRHWLVEGDWE